MYRRHLVWLLAVLAVFTLQACGGGEGGSGGSTQLGTVTISLTDAPGDFDHVWITVKDIWFHTNDTAGPDDSAWQKSPLAIPVTVDLLSLSNGTVGSPVWGNVKLPAGAYQQIRLVLAPTDPSVLDPLTTTAASNNMTFNNEVVIGSTHYPLRVPDAKHGIRLAGIFQVTEGGTLKLAIDFDAGHDIVDIQRTVNHVTVTEYILKPTLAYFDLDDAGAIVGSIDLASAATSSVSRFVIKAEQPNDPLKPQYHAVRRWTIVNPSTGRFVLYPLKAGSSYDIVMRGIGYQTVIIKGVPVTQGTTPLSGATTIPRITMAASSGDYSVAGTIASPTGAWVNFYQTLQDGSLPYEIRFRHFNPVTGQFTGFKLSADQLQVATYGTGTLVSSPTATTPAGGNGAFTAVAGAILYDPSAPQSVTSGSGTITFPALSPKSPPSVPGGNSISGIISKPSGSVAATMDKGLLLVAHGGMIVNAVPVDLSGGTNTPYAVPNLPGGSPVNPLPLAFYGVDALGWSSTGPAAAIAVPDIADLRTGDAAGIDMNLIMLP